MKHKLIGQERYFIYSIVMLSVILPNFVNAEIAIIANKSNTLSSISELQAASLWLAKKKTIAGSEKLKVSDAMERSPTYIEFYNKVVNKTPKQIRIYWGKMIFSGKTFPPPKQYSDAEMLQWVSSTNNALGYIDASSVNDSVKVLLKK